MMHSCVMRQEADLVTVGGGVVEGERREQIFLGRRRSRKWYHDKGNAWSRFALTLFKVHEIW